MKVEIPKEDSPKTIIYLEKEYTVTSMKLKDAALFDKKDGQVQPEQILAFIRRRLPEMTPEQVDEIPTTHLEPLLNAISEACGIVPEKKSTSS